MHPVSLLIIAAGNITLGFIAWRYFKRFQEYTLKHAAEIEAADKELKRRVLELSVLRSLGERVGYSLDLRQILEVLIDSLSGVVEFSTIAYIIPGKEGRCSLKIRVAEGVSRSFFASVKEQVLKDFSSMTEQNLYSGLVDETVSGSALDDSVSLPIGSYFNLPIVIGGKVAALVNVASCKIGLYGDEETAVLYTILGQVSTQANKLIQVVENEKRRLSAMVASLADGVMMVDLGFNPIVVNRILPNLLGLKQVQILYDVVAAIGTGADFEGALRHSLSTQQLLRLPEISIGEKAVQIDLEPVKDKFGIVLGVAVVFHDVTARKQLERLRDEFTAMMVHELRTPLTTISYSTDMMLSDIGKMTSEQVGESIKIVQSTASHMLELVNELLDVAKIEAGKFQIVKKEDNLASLVSDTVAMIKPMADQKHLQIVLSVAPDLPTISFDRRRIGQVLNNLLSNAIKYTETGQIEILAHSTHSTGSGQAGSGQVVVSVKDSGEGIPAEDLPKLFSKFEQLGKGETGEKGGTGLGLVVAKGIVEAHGGKIRAESEGPGKGTTFSFTLPLN